MCKRKRNNEISKKKNNSDLNYRVKKINTTTLEKIASKYDGPCVKGIKKSNEVSKQNEFRYNLTSETNKYDNP